MRITFFGALWILLLIYCFFSKDYKKILFVAFLSMVLQSNNICTIGETGIGVQIFTISVAWVRLWFVERASTRLRSARPMLFFGIALLLSAVLSLTLNDGWESGSLISVAMIFVYVGFMLTLIRKNICADETWMEKTENAIIILVLIVGVFQVACKAGAAFLEGPLRVLIYNDVNNPDVVFHTKTTSRFYSTFMEPSYCGAFLVGAFALLAVRKERTKTNVILAVAVAIAILMTKSSAAYGGLAIIVCLLLITRGQRPVFKFIIPIGILIGLFVVLFNMELLNEVIFDKGDSGSARVRRNLNQWAVEAFKTKPWLGVGYRKQRGSSLFYTMLAEMGVVGLAVYLFNTAYQLKTAVFTKAANEVKGKSYFVLGIIICQFIACPDLNFSPYWLGMYLLVIGLRQDEDRLQQTTSETT